MPGLIYSKSGNDLYVNLYASNEALVKLKDQDVVMSQITSYPWDGKVKLDVSPEKEGKFTIKLRVPGWARNEVLPGDLYHFATQTENQNTITINDEKLDARVENGYYTITRNWKDGDKITLDFPMTVRKVEANPLVEENQGKMSLEYGPLVYAVEEVDNKESFDNIHVSTNDAFNVEMQSELLGGVNTISNKNLTAIPYYAWSNRGIGKMKVWLPTENMD